VPEFYTKEGFAEHVNTKFTIPLEPSGAIELELVEVVSTLSTPRQEQFSVFFRGPANIYLPQMTYHMTHDAMGELDLFIVPVGRQPDGFHYEAVFNRPLDPQD
jgi:hypothetical protein